MVNVRVLKRLLGLWKLGVAAVINPHSPPSAPTQQLLQGPHPKRKILLLLAVFLLIECEEFQQVRRSSQDTEATKTASKFPAIISPLIDPAKLDSLKGKRAATPSLRKACHWLKSDFSLLLCGL